MITLCLIVAVAAFACFALATDPHHRKRIGGPCPKPRVKALRAAAWGLLGIGFVLAMLAWGPVFGAIGWAGAIMAGAAATFLFLNFGPAWKIGPH
ncbi:DUF3325 family protein [Sphingomonas immobilis]|uniref:DUF3325 family protein n=1 Tax=Sphingomonas immobilis TaxID=3063997 RepID=A0ABT8ZTF4_9SPHN|nr:DUF3325 family protein [Sphingomonas sp. CA1-15]MDO7840837.1 DUF3325 family protein [Sphingomonas sp. CA1-15]